MKTALRTCAFTATTLVLLSFLAGVASGLAAEPNRPHDVLLTLAITGFFVAAFLPGQRALHAPLLRRSTALLLGGSAGTITLLLVAAVVRSLFSNGGGDAEALWHPSVAAAAKAGAFLVCALLARCVSSSILRWAVPPLGDAVDDGSVGTEEHA